jgi:hypothetical protein
MTTATTAATPIRSADYSALFDVAAGLGAGVVLDGQWVLADDGGPVIAINSQPHDAPPVIDPMRRALVLLAPQELVTVVAPENSLIALTRMTLAARGALASRAVCLEDAGAVPAASSVNAGAADEVLVERHGLPLAWRVGRHVYVASVTSFSNRLLAAESNAELVNYALTGACDDASTDRVHRWSEPVAAHAAPMMLDALALVWDMPDAPSSDVALSGAAFAGAIRRASRRLPEPVYEALLTFADASHPSGALLIRGIPVGQLPATPATPTTPSEKDRVSEQVLLAAGRVLGQPIGYLPEHGGDIVQNLLPTRESAHRQVSTSSAVTLAWHTEAAFHPHRPRFLLLLCLRGDPAARTTLCSVREVLGALSLRTRWLLSEPLFRTTVDESYVGARSQRLGPRVPVLAGDLDSPRMVFDADLMVGVTDEATAALAELTEAIERHHTHVVLESGDLLVVDNSVAVHGRSPFTPRFDGTDRWLQRTFVVTDLAASAGERSGRVIRTRFQA